MKSMMLAAGFGLVMLSSGIALADDSSTGNAQTASMAGADHNPVTCRMTYHDGELIRRLTCMTAAQWHFVRYLNQEEIRTWQNRGLLQTGH